MSKGRKVFYFTLLVSIIFIFIYHNNSKQNELVKVLNIPLKNILSDDNILKVSSQRQIFLIEAHMNKERSLDNARQACSVESAGKNFSLEIKYFMKMFLKKYLARTNPDMEVYFIFLTNSSEGINMKYSELVDGLLSYSNIHLRYLYPKEFSKGTKLEKFFERDALNKSLFPVGHAADIIRVLILNKYGGQYLDLDIISLMPLAAINRVNFACAESENMVANGVMNVDTNEQGGKLFSEKYLE